MSTANTEESQRRLQAWHEVWERKGREALQCADINLQTLLDADGYDSVTSGLRPEAFRAWLLEVADNLGIAAGTRVLEVGCGAGAVLHVLSAIDNITLVGLDYSEHLLRLAEAAAPNALLLHREAAAANLDGARFDVVLCIGVFYYFPSLDYARLSLEEMVRATAPGGRIFIADIPDLRTKEVCETERRAAAARHGQEYRTTGPTAHLYYPVEFFTTFAQERGWTMDVYERSIAGYGNARFRYHVVLQDPARIEEQLASQPCKP